MGTSLHRPSRPFASHAFSLVELLVVLAIVAILAAMATPVISSALRSYQIDSTSQLIINQLNLARQTALSRGHAVQFRFYQLPDYNLAASGTPVVYRGMQSFIEGDPIQGTPVTVAITPLVKATFFPSPVIISSTTSPSPVSPLVSGTSTTTVTVNANDTANPLPVFQGNYKYVVFRFKPDGSTDLTAVTNSISLVLEKDKTVANGLPANFLTIAIDPLNGTIRSFRP